MATPTEAITLTTDPQINVIDPLSRPVALSEEQILDLVAAVPEIQGASRESKETARQSMVKSLVKQLRGIQITPLGVPELRTEIQRRFYRSLIEAGSMVGVHAAEAIGGPVTQMALKTFHQSGSSKNISMGVDAMRELFNITRNRKRENATIRFQDQHLTHDDVLAKQAEIVGLLVADVIDDFTVDSIDALDQRWWHEMFPVITGRAIPQTRWVLRLYLKVNSMYSYRVDMEQLASAIEAGSPNGLVCVYSPIDEGIIDIYPDETLVAEALREHSLPIEEPGTLVFLTQIVQPNLDKIAIKGVPNIRKIYPVTVPVWQIIADERRVYTDEQVAQTRQQDPVMASTMERAWYLYFNKLRMNTTGIGTPKIVRLCEVAGITIYQQTEDNLIVIMPETIPTNLTTNENTKEGKFRRDLRRPGHYVQALIEQDERDEARYENEQKQLGNHLFRRPPTEMYRAAKYTYADTDGTNLRSLMGREDVDPYHTVSGNAHEIFGILGIEACRNFLISEILNVIMYEGEYINPRHIAVLVDFMTNRGEPLPITFTGISRQPIGALAKASFERAMDNFRDAGGFGRREPIASTSTSIYVGKRAQIGTGAFDVQTDENMVNQFRQQVNQIGGGGTVPQVDINQFKTAIDDIDDITFGTGTMDFNQDEAAGLDIMFGGETVPTLTGTTVPTVTALRNVTINEQPAIGEVRTIDLKPSPILPQQLTGVVDRFTTAPGIPYTDEPNQVTLNTLPTTRVPTVGLPTLTPTTPTVNTRRPTQARVQLANTDDF